MIENAIFERMTGDPEFLALAGERAYPIVTGPNGDETLSNLADSEPRPYLTYQLISDPEEYTLDGPVGLVRARYQFNSYGDTFEQARTLYRIVRRLFNGVTFELDGTYVAWSRKESGRDLWDDEGEPKLYVNQTDFTLVHTE